MPKRIWGTLDPFVEGGDILGRKVANISFLTALLRMDAFDEYHFFMGSDAALAYQEAWLKERFPHIAVRGGFAFFLYLDLQWQLAGTRYEVFHLSDSLHRQVALARLRNAYASHLFPITAPTHSLSYVRFMPDYLAHLWPGACGRDVILATSASAKSMLENTFSRLESAYGLEGKGFHRPRLELVPLGIEAEGFPAPEERWDAPSVPGEYGGGKAVNTAALHMREHLGLTDEVMFLCLARISASSKMDCLPLISSFARAGELGLDLSRCCLVVAGWAEEGDPLPETLRRYADLRGVRLVHFLRPAEDERRALYAAADCFLSPSDNIQETFGLTLAEAGISGLPVIASDFDGYRDIVVHGETGLLVPTTGFARSGETNLLASLWYDNQYHLKLAQETAVDIPGLAKAILRIAADPALRRRMGEAGRRRCLDLFTADVIVRRYHQLWKDLAAQPLSAEEEARIRKAVHPLALDFAVSFKAHFTNTMGISLDAPHEAASGIESGESGYGSKGSPSRIFQRTPMGDDLYEGRTPPSRYAGHEYMLDADALRRVLLAARKPAGGQELLQAAAGGLNPELPAAAREERVAFTVLWALKQGYIEETT